MRSNVPLEGDYHLRCQRGATSLSLRDRVGVLAPRRCPRGGRTQTARPASSRHDITGDAGEGSTFSLPRFRRDARAVRAERRTVLSGDLLRNRWLVGGLALSQVLHLAVIFAPPLNHVLHTTPSSFREFLAVGVVASLMLWVEEGRKLVVRWRQTGGRHLGTCFTGGNEGRPLTTTVETPDAARLPERCADRCGDTLCHDHARRD